MFSSGKSPEKPTNPNPIFSHNINQIYEDSFFIKANSKANDQNTIKAQIFH